MKIYKFFSPTCGPCKVLEMSFKKANIEHENIDATLDANEALLTKFNVTTVPVVIKTDDNDTEIARFHGAKTAQQLEDWINEN